MRLDPPAARLGRAVTERLPSRRACVGHLAMAGCMVVILGGLRDRGPAASQANSAVDVLLTTAPSGAEAPLGGPLAERCCRLLLDDAVVSLATACDLQAVFHKREQIDGTLQDLNVMEIKVRREPASVYLRWNEPYEGREVIWREGADDGKLLVHGGGWRRRLVPLLKIDPYGERALEYSRRPVTEIGIWNFARRLQTQVAADLKRGGLDVSMWHDRLMGGRACYCFELAHRAPGPDAPYQRLEIYIDQATGLPIACQRFNWAPPGGDARGVLDESYVYHELVLNCGLSDADFDPASSHYQFGSR